MVIKLDQSVEIRPKSPDVNLETRPNIKVVRNTKEGCVLADLSFEKFPGMRGVCVDQGYRGTFARTVREKWEREVHISAREGKGLEIEPKRWVAERTFGWFNGQRRLGKDHEKLTCVSEAMLYIAAIARSFKNHIFN